MPAAKRSRDEPSPVRDVRGRPPPTRGAPGEWFPNAVAAARADLIWRLLGVGRTQLIVTQLDPFHDPTVRRHATATSAARAASFLRADVRGRP